MNNTTPGIRIVANPDFRQNAGAAHAANTDGRQCLHSSLHDAAVLFHRNRFFM